MRAGFSHLPVKHDLNKSNMMIFYKCKRFSFLEAVVILYCFTLYLIKIPIKGFLPPLPPTVSERRAVRLKTIILTDCKLQMLIFDKELLYNCSYSNSFNNYNCLSGHPHIVITSFIELYIYKMII